MNSFDLRPFGHNDMFSITGRYLVEPGQLTLEFSVKGSRTELIIPAQGSSGRQDNLWQHTCLECFLRLGDREEYVEVNLSPSGAWNTYRFDSYRSGMRTAGDIEVESLKTMVTDLEFKLSAKIRGILDLRFLGPTAVLETRHGHQYFALTHPDDKPDFHWKGCHILTVENR